MIKTVKQVSEMLHITPKKVREYILEGRLTAFKIGRIYRIEQKDLIKFIDENKTKKPNNENNYNNNK